MSSVKVIRYLLANNVALNAAAPATRIMAGVLPQGTAVPAIAVSHISTKTLTLVAQAALSLCTSRVQVTVMANDYPSLQSTKALVRAALPRSRGSINTVAVESVIDDIEGPDFTDEAGLWFGSIDYIVTWNG